MVWMSLAGSVLAAAVGAQVSPDSVLLATSIAEPADGPAVIVREQPAQALVAVRLSVPVADAAGAEEVVRVLQELARRRFESEAAALGARTTLTRSPSHAVYAIVGPREVFDAMVASLRRAVGPPELSGAGWSAARLAARHARDAELDTPEPLIRYRLQRALFPELGAAADAVADLSADRVRRIWAESYIPERMTAIVVGAMSAEAAAAPFRDWPEPERPRREPPLAAAPGAAPEPQSVRSWAGLGYASDADPVALAAAASLIARHLSSLALRSSSAELWWSGDRRALVVLGSAAPPDSGTAAGDAVLAQRLGEAVAEIAPLVTSAAVAAVRRELRHDLLFAGRTPQGLAELIGSFRDRTGDPRAAQRFLNGLARVDADDVRDALRSLDAPVPVAAGAGS